MVGRYIHLAKHNFKTYLSDILRYSDFLGYSSCFWPDFKVTGLSLAKEWPGLWSLMWLGTTCSRLQSLALFLSHSLPKLGLGWSNILLSSKEGMGSKRRRDTTNTPQGRRVTDPVQMILYSASYSRTAKGLCGSHSAMTTSSHPHLPFQDFLLGVTLFWHAKLQAGTPYSLLLFSYQT